MAKKKPIPDETPEQPTPGYTVLARRYRPQQFADLIGQEAVAQALINAIESNRVAHAYLFTGARGVGKTSAARILAKALNCVKGPTRAPCDQCEICQAITGGDDTDVLEIDGASNNGIDNIRDLRSNVQYRPTRSRYKIYIIDEVHMVTTQAFNALLKTLEEPPPHVKFIFATTEVQKIPITILSRCQRFDFGGISIPLILQRLKEIVSAEGMSADEEALETVARRAGGSMRDAQSLLDQLLAFSGQKLTVDTVHQLLGTAHEERVIAIADAVLAKDAKLVLEILNDIVNQGQQLGELLEQLIEYWRDLMIVNSAGLAGQSVSVSSTRRDTLEKHAQQGNLDSILAGMDILVTAKARMRHSSHARALIEMALIRLCQLADLLPIAQIAQWLANEGGNPSVSRTGQAGGANAKTASAPPAPLEKKKLTSELSDISSVISVPLSPDSLSGIWQQVVVSAGFAIQAELRNTNAIAISGPNSLDLSVFRRYNRPDGVFSDSAKLGKVTDILSRIVGQKCTIRIVWTDEPVEALANGAGKSAAAVAMGQQRQMRGELLQIPLVKKATDVLGAQVIRADEGFGVATTQSTLADATENPPEDE